MAHLICFMASHKATMNHMGFKHGDVERLHLSFFYSGSNARPFCKWNKVSTPTIVLDDADFSAMKMVFTGADALTATVSDDELAMIRDGNQEWIDIQQNGPRWGKPSKHRAIRKMIVGRMEQI